MLSVRFQDGFAQIQPEAQATAAVRAGIFAGVKQFEDMRQVFRGNARTVIGYRNDHAVILTLILYMDLRSVRRVLDRIADEIVQYLQDQGNVHPCDQTLRWRARPIRLHRWDESRHAPPAS